MTRAWLTGMIFAMSLALVMGSRAAANDIVRACFDKTTNAEQKTCMAAIHRAARGELEVVYGGVLASAQARRTEKYNPAVAIEASQKAWEAYRNAECGDVVGGGTWGSGTAAMVLGCYAEKDYERIQELKVPFYMR